MLSFEQQNVDLIIKGYVREIKPKFTLNDIIGITVNFMIHLNILGFMN